MTDQRVTYGTVGQPTYSTMRNTNEYGYGANTSAGVNVNVGSPTMNQGSNIYRSGNVPIGVTTSGMAGTASNVPGMGSNQPQQIKQTVYESGPGYTRKEQYTQSQGPYGGTYQRTSVQQTQKPNYTSSQYVQPNPSGYRAPAPVGQPAAPQNYPIYNQQPQGYREEYKNRCPNALLGILGLLAIIGIILALLFGLGVLGGKKNYIAPPPKTQAAPIPANATGATVAVETAVLNRTETAPILTPPNTNPPLFVPTSYAASSSANTTRNIDTTTPATIPETVTIRTERPIAFPTTETNLRTQADREANRSTFFTVPSTVTTSQQNPNIQGSIRLRPVEVEPIPSTSPVSQ